MAAKIPARSIDRAVSLQSPKPEPPARTRAALATGSRSPWKKEGPSSGAFQSTRVLSEWQSSRSGREQLPVFRQNYLIDGMNDAVGRDEIGLRDEGSINLHV